MRVKSWTRDHKLLAYGIVATLVAAIVTAAATIVAGNIGASGANNGVINNGTINYGPIYVAPPAAAPSASILPSRPVQIEASSAESCADFAPGAPVYNGVTAGLLAKQDGHSESCWTLEFDPDHIPSAVEYLVWYKNTGKSPQRSVYVAFRFPHDQVPTPGSIVLYNGNYLNGYTFPVTNANEVTVNIGDYNPDDNGIAYVKVTATTPFAEELQCGANTDVMQAWVGPVGSTLVHLQLKVNMTRHCDPSSSST